MEKLNYSQNELKWVRDLNVKATWTHLEKINVTYSIIKIHYIRHFKQQQPVKQQSPVRCHQNCKVAAQDTSL